MVVDEIMTLKPVTARSSTSIRRVLDLLGDADVRHIPVVDDGELVGIVSDRDLRAFVSPPLAMLENPAELRERMSQAISTVMSSDVVTVTPETNVEEAIDLMLDQKVGAVPVVNDETRELVGIVSYMDVLRAARTALAD
jgi:acetoin utilization protein AcuB